MELRVEERLGLLSVLPEVGNFITLRIVSDLRRELAFTEEEVKSLSLTQHEGRVTWDATQDKPVEVSIGEKATDIIVDALKKADSQEQLNATTMPLYERFVANSNHDERG